MDIENVKENKMMKAERLFFCNGQIMENVEFYINYGFVIIDISGKECWYNTKSISKVFNVTEKE